MFEGYFRVIFELFYLLVLLFKWYEEVSEDLDGICDSYGDFNVFLLMGIFCIDLYDIREEVFWMAWT